MAKDARYEPTIHEILADPTVKALMKADRVNPDRLEMKLLRLRHVLSTANAADGRDRGLSAARGSDFSPCRA